MFINKTNFQKIIDLFPYLLYLILVIPLYRQLPMHEEVVHLITSDSWSVALEYWWHPPTYVLILKLFRGVLIENYIGTYIVGGVAAFLNIYLIGKILNQLLGNKYSDFNFYSLLGKILFATMPVVISGSILLEMEPVLVTPVVLFVIYYYLSLQGKSDSLKSILYLALLIGVSYWTKIFATPLLLMFSIFIHDYITSKYWRRNIILIGFVSISFFLLTYEAYSYFFLNFKNTLSFIVTEKVQADLPLYLSGRILLPMLSKIGSWFFWFSPFFLILIFYCLRTINKNNYKLYSNELYLIGFALSILSFYLLGSPYLFFEFKYFYPAFPLIIIVVISIIAKQNAFYFDRMFALLFIVSLIVFLIFVKDPLYVNITMLRQSQYGNLFLYNFKYLCVCLLLFYLCRIGFASVLKNQDKALIATLICLTFSANLNMLLSQFIGGYQTKYQYGEIGAPEVIKFIKENINTSDTYVMSYDVSYYAGVNYKPIANNLIEYDKKNISNELDWIVVRKVELLSFFSERTKDYDLVFSQGSYLVFRSKRYYNN
jgi:hypothetical protein